MKVTVVGGGSTYTPELVDGIARLRDLLPVDELVLADPATDRVEVVAEMSRRMLARADHPAKVVATSDIDSGVSDADAVLLQLRVGGQAARMQDEAWPMECGCIGQETTGAGGLAKALRTVPVVLEIAELVRKRAAPGAWIVDFTNPVGIVTRALLQAGHRAVGLCNVAIGFERYFAELLDVAPEDVALGHVGLNHLTWERSVTVGGRDVLPELIERHGAELADRVDQPEWLVRQLGVIPSYYLHYFYNPDAAVEAARGAQSRGAQVAEMERTLLEMYADPGVDTKPELLGRRGGAFYSEAAINLLASLTADRGDAQVVNLRNDGALPFLPDDAVIEVPATITASGAEAVPVDPVPPLYSGLISHTFAYEQLALEAALHGGRDRVFQALLAHPLVGQVETATGLTDRLLAANRDHLGWAR
ncbi:MAG: 6-phospho-beta-glucosidase [Nocardioidaceae bacterium]|nr:6-phospho-beta-glucosidase [Nocardioidaceae bacterium]